MNFFYELVAELKTNALELVLKLELQKKNEKEDL